MRRKVRSILSMLCAIVMLMTTLLQAVPVNAVQESATHSGTWAMAVDLSGADWKAATMDIDVKANTDYVVKYWLKGTSVVGTAVKSDDWGSTLAWAENTAANNWTQVTMTFNSGVSTRIHLQMVDTTSEGLVYIDDLFVGLAKTGAANLAANGDFEAGATGWAYEEGVKISIAQPGLVVTNSTINPTSAVFNKYTTEQRDITVIITANGNTLKAIKNGTAALVPNTDYITSGTTVKIKKEYLATLAAGSAALTFDFDKGNDPDIKIEITNVPVAQGILDDFYDLDKAYEYSKNADGTAGFWISENESPDTFEGDGYRLIPNRVEDRTIVYKTDYDITSFYTLTYNWVNVSAIDPVVSVSADGTTYTDLTLTKNQLGIVGSNNDWAKIVYYNFEMPISNARYIKMTVPKLAAGDNQDAGWSYQFSKLIINRCVMPVSANPPTGKISGTVNVTLSTPTADAKIYYFTKEDPKEKLYTSPISISKYTELTAYAKKAGMEDSVKNTYIYYSTESITVDKYGQWKNADFATKVTSDEQLVADVAADKEYYDSLTPPERDIYGGMLGSKEKYNLEATGFFRVQKLAFNKGEAEKFVMVDPLGNLYFSLGTCCTGSPGETYTMVQGREQIYEWIPENEGIYTGAFLGGNSAYYSPYVANLIKKYGKAFDQNEYYARMIDRLKKLGFTSEGGFAETPSVEDNKTGFPEIPFQYLPDGYKLGNTTLFDPYKEGAREAIAQWLVKNNVPARKDDSKIVGYFFGNELPYHSFDATVLGLKASESATKGALIDMLKAKYKKISALNKVWASDFESFDAMKEAAITLNTDLAADDMGEFFEQYLHKFYGMLSEEFKKVDPNHMLMGDRYFVNVADTADIRDTLCRVAGQYLDVISYNYYTYDVDLERLKAISEAADKPIMITEFHFSEPTQGLDAPGIGVDTEEEKGLYYRYYVEKLAASGYAVGAHWFEMMDQAATGRWFQGVGGEAAGIGLFNVADRPYKTFLKSVMDTNYNIYDIITGEVDYLKNPNPPVQKTQMESLIPKAEGTITIDGTKDAIWPAGETIKITDADRVTGAQVENVSADIDLAWDDNNLYVFAHIKDPTPMQNPNVGDWMWNGDGLELFVGPQLLESPGSLKVTDSQLVLSGSADGNYIWYNNKNPQPKVELVTKMDSDKAGYTIEAAIPLSGLNVTNIGDGRQLRFDIALDNGEVDKRVGQYVWSGGSSNSSSRDKWGMVKLVNKVDIKTSTFSDIEKYNWAKKAIDAVAAKGILAGVSTDKFNPSGSITRGEFTASLMKAFGLSGKVASNFSDVKATHKYYNEIGIAKKLGIATGDNGKFSPDKAISRQDMMVLVTRTLNYVKKNLPAGTASNLSKFSDKAKIAAYAKDSAAALVKSGIITGNNSKIKPASKLSRAAAAVILYRLMK
ncbi:MAG: S-layer homology domain-containing protein [Mobilitalea sp.]